MDGFIMLKRLGKGSFGIVYKVKRKQDNKIYALKRVESSQDNLNEVRLLASLNHPNIVKFYDAFPFYKSGTRIINLSIIMEYAGGGDLTKLINSYKLKQKYISEKRIWKYTYQIASALEHLHRHDILHRDLKAANCFLTNDDNIKLGDMNISKVIKNGQLAHTKIGTPYYMSPEIWNNTPYNEKCDIWALGCLIYELACFKVPFEGNSVNELKRHINKGYYIKTPNNIYSHQLWTLINQMLCINPVQRISINQIITVSSKKIDKVSDHEIYQNVDSNILNTIKMTPRLQQLTNRMPQSKYIGTPVLNRELKLDRPTQVNNIINNHKNNNDIIRNKKKYNKDEIDDIIKKYKPKAHKNHCNTTPPIEIKPINNIDKNDKNKQNKVNPSYLDNDKPSIDGRTKLEEISKHGILNMYNNVKKIPNNMELQKNTPTKLSKISQEMSDHKKYIYSKYNIYNRIINGNVNIDKPEMTPIKGGIISSIRQDARSNIS